jgi:casein kinase I family protein HRR25
MEKKMTTTYEELTKGIPKEFGLFLKYSRNLEFEDKPNYNYLR